MIDHNYLYKGPCSRVARAILLVLAALAASMHTVNAQITREKLTATYLFRLAENIQWANEAAIERYHIHLIDSSGKTAKEIERIARDQQLHGKPVKVTRSRDIEVPETAQLIYLAKDRTADYPAVFKKVEGRNILLVSDNVANERIIMINLIETPDKQIVFKINKANILNQNLGINPDIILLGGTEIDVAQLYKETQRELREKEQLLDGLQEDIQTINAEKAQLQQTITSQKAEIDRQLKQLETTKQEVTSRQKELQEQLAKSEVQQQLYQKLLDETQAQEVNLKKQAEALRQRAEQLNEQQLEIDKRNEILSQQEGRIETLDRQIEDQRKVLEEQGATITAQRQRLQLLAVVTGSAVLFILLVLKANQRARQLNSRLESEIMEREKLENELKLTSERLELGVEAASLGIWDWELSSNTTTWSDKMFDIYELPPRVPMPYETWANSVYPPDLGKATAMLENVIKNKAFMGVEFRITRPGGEIRTIEAKALALCDDQGEVCRVIGTNLDITERKLAEEKLQEAKKVAVAASRAKSEFLANMSHEIRTPMNAVLGFAEILAGIEAEPRKKRYIENIHTAGHALLNLINDILDLSKVEAGKLELQYSATSLKHLFDELETIFLQKVNDKGLQLNLSLDEALPEALVLDEVRLRQVLINLIGNAIKFTESGFIRVDASVAFPEATQSTVRLRLKVQDSGIGIAEDQQSKIFAAFAQTAGQKAREFGGTGLGLAISQRLIDMMGGTLSVESELGTGSTFSIELAEVEVAAGEAPAAKGPLVDFSQLQFEPATVLVADDVDYNREILQTYLADFGFTFYEAVNGKDVLAKVGEHRPDLILLDMKMPDMDGYEVAEIMNKDEALKDIPTVAITASALKRDEEVISKLCDGYLRKPVSREELIRELMKYLPYSRAEERMVAGEKKEAPPAIDRQAANPEKLSGLLQQLEGEVSRQWDNREKLSISETGAFADTLNRLGEQFDDPPLVDWGSRLQQAVARFDIEAVNQQMLEFPNLIQKIKDDLSRLEG